MKGPSRERRERALGLKARGMSVRQIAAELGVSKSTAGRYIRPPDYKAKRRAPVDTAKMDPSAEVDATLRGLVAFYGVAIPAMADRIMREIEVGSAPNLKALATAIAIAQDKTTMAASQLRDLEHARTADEIVEPDFSWEDLGEDVGLQGEVVSLDDARKKKGATDGRD